MISENSFIPNQAFGASLRGPDMIDWYTSAWLHKYLRHDASADKRLLTQRWRHDPVQKSIDPGHDPNVFSFYYYSRLDIHLFNGKTFRWRTCAGCPGMVANDGYSGGYSYMSIDTSPDGVSGAGVSLASLTSVSASKP